MKTIPFNMLLCKKLKGGKNALWHAWLGVEIIMTVPVPVFVGAGNTADNAIKDYQKQFRAWAISNQTVLQSSQIG